MDKNVVSVDVKTVLKHRKVQKYELYQLALVTLSMPETQRSVELAFSGFLTTKIQYRWGNVGLCCVSKTEEF